jgi:heme exporter protein CcmD
MDSIPYVIAAYAISATLIGGLLVATLARARAVRRALAQNEDRAA